MCKQVQFPLIHASIKLINLLNSELNNNNNNSLSYKGKIIWFKEKKIRFIYLFICINVSAHICFDFGRQYFFKNVHISHLKYCWPCSKIIVGYIIIFVFYLFIAVGVLLLINHTMQK